MARQPAHERSYWRLFERTARIIVACGMLAWCPCAFALNPTLDVHQYIHTSWKARDGFIQGTISAITQTHDGYLWLGTDSGLFRFDGVRALLWQPPSGQRLPSDFVMSLLVSRDGTLWIGTRQGLASWKDGRLDRYETLAASTIGTILEDRQGSIWVTRGATSWTLCRVQKTRVTCYGEDGSAGADAIGLYEDRKGQLWVGTLTGLWKWQPGPPVFSPLAGEINGIRGLSESDDGSLLVAQLGGIRRLRDGKTVMAYPFPASSSSVQVPRLRRDRDGGLWVGTSSGGLIYITERITDVFSQTDGLSGDAVTALFEDREGSIWVGTGEGLDRFRASAAVSHSTRQGLLNDQVNSVLASRDGSVWMATIDGLNRWADGRV